MQKIKKRGAVVLGMSGDTIAAHQKFKTNYGLNFPLLSDVERKVIARYGAIKEKDFYGKKLMGIARSTFVIDEERKILKIFPNVKVAGHFDDVLEALK